MEKTIPLRMTIHSFNLTDENGEVTEMDGQYDGALCEPANKDE